MYKFDFGHSLRLIYQLLVIVATILLSIEIFDNVSRLENGEDTVRALIVLICDFIYNLIGTMIVAAIGHKVEEGLWWYFLMKAIGTGLVIRMTRNYAIAIFELALVITIAGHLIVQVIVSKVNAN